MTTEYVIDGSKVMTLESFYDQIADTFAIGFAWGRNLDALEEVLCDAEPIGTEKAKTVRWRHSAVSKANLGYAETVRHLEERLAHCHPSNRGKVRAELAQAREGRGPTVFDWLVEIIRDHDDRMNRSKSSIRLLLE